MTEVKKNWKNLGYAHGPLKQIEPKKELSFGAFLTAMDSMVAIGFVFYLGRFYVSFWWLK